MGRQGGRSKGCQTCRQRRVKCDEAQPECGQCLRTGRKCPGATAGNVFINISPDVDTGPTQPPSRLQIPRDTRVKAASEPALSSTRSKASSQNASDSEESTTSQLITVRAQTEPPIRHVTDVEALQVSMEDIASMELPQWYQPSKADIFQQHFTAHFIANFFNPSSFLTKTNIWVYHIPAIIYSSPSPAVQCSIRAATMALYGTKTGDVALQLEASKWYGKGLGQQRTELERIDEIPDTQQRQITTLLAPLMFCMFETVMVTNPTGWSQHLHAASKLLEILGPKACQDGVATSLFRSIRIGMIYIIMTWEKPPALASDAWCTIPFEHRPKTILDVLDDILFQFPPVYALRKRWLDLTEALDPEASAVREQVKAASFELLSKLSWFWSHFGEHLQGKLTLDMSDGMRFPTIFDRPMLSPSVETAFRIPTSYRDTFAAQTIGKYNAGAIIAYGLLRSITPMNEGYNNEINLHGESIMAAVAYHEASGPSHSGCISMIFPMRSLIVVTRSDPLREAAKEAILKWGRRRGVGKICNLQIEKPDASEKFRMPFQYDDRSFRHAS